MDEGRNEIANGGAFTTVGCPDVIGGPSRAGDCTGPNRCASVGTVWVFPTRPLNRAGAQIVYAPPKAVTFQFLMVAAAVADAPDRVAVWTHAAAPDRPLETAAFGSVPDVHLPDRSGDR